MNPRYLKTIKWIRQHRNKEELCAQSVCSEKRVILEERIWPQVLGEFTTREYPGMGKWPLTRLISGLCVNDRGVPCICSEIGGARCAQSVLLKIASRQRPFQILGDASRCTFPRISVSIDVLNA
jgi:hypothetical protein